MLSILLATPAVAMRDWPRELGGARGAEQSHAANHEQDVRLDARVREKRIEAKV